MQNEKVFKLVFSTDGHFLHAEGPDGEKANMELSIEEMSEKKYKTRQGEPASFRDLLLTGGKEDTIYLVDVPGSSICGGRCQGVPFRFPWCS